MQTRVLIIAGSLFVTASHQACSTTNAHGLPSCPLNAALDAGDAIGLLQACQYNSCCWCSDTNFTSQLNETWKRCSEADRDEAYRFFQSECNAQDPPVAATNTTSSLNHTASSNSTLPSRMNSTSDARPSSFSVTVTTSSSSSPTVPASLSSSSLSSTLTSSSSPTHTNRATPGRNMYNSVITTAFVMAAVAFFRL